MRKLTSILSVLMVLMAQPVAAQFSPQDLPGEPNAVEVLRFDDTYRSDYLPGTDLYRLGTIVGPYKGTWMSSGDPTMPQITLYCIDKFNSVGYGNVWDANMTVLDGSQALGNTRLGSVADDATYGTPLDRYRQVAFLAALFETEAAASWAALHAAIWTITAGPRDAWTPGGLLTATETTAYTDFLSYAAGAKTADASLFKGWYVATDVNADGQYTGKQEYLVRMAVVPEPQTYILLLSGLVAIFFVARRRMKENGYA